MILVAYASKLGSTREVAEVIAGVLSAQGHDVDLSHVTEVRDSARTAVSLSAGRSTSAGGTPMHSNSSSSTATGSPSALWRSSQWGHAR